MTIGPLELLGLIVVFWLGTKVGQHRRQMYAWAEGYMRALEDVGFVPGGQEPETDFVTAQRRAADEGLQ